MFSGLESPAHLLIVLVIAMLVLGPKRLPEMGRSLGAGIRHFKDSMAGEVDVEKEGPAADPKKIAVVAEAEPVVTAPPRKAAHVGVVSSTGK